MDNFWKDVVGYVHRATPAAARIVGPDGFADALVLVIPGASGAAIEAVDVLILHKTDYHVLPPLLVARALKAFIVGFANEVFIVLAREPHSVDAKPDHLAALAEIRTWAEAEYRDSQVHAIVPQDAPRMAPCYVGKGRVLLQSGFGHLMLVAGEDTSIAPHLIRDGWFDLDLTRFLTRTLRSGETFVDVGANFGTYSLIAAEIVGDGGRVLSIEANPAIAEILHENMVMNGFGDRATVLREAAAAAAGSVELYAFSIRQGGSTMIADVALRAGADYAERVVRQSVAARTLDEMVDATGISAIDLLKIDVEGYESMVLAGANSCIKRLRPKILLEWHPSFLTDGVAQELYSLLTERFGYRLRRVESGGVTQAIDRDELMTIAHSDILAVPAF